MRVYYKVETPDNTIEDYQKIVNNQTYQTLKFSVFIFKTSAAIFLSLPPTRSCPCP